MKLIDVRLHVINKVFFIKINGVIEGTYQDKGCPQKDHPKPTKKKLPLQYSSLKIFDCRIQVLQPNSRKRVGKEEYRRNKLLIQAI